MVENMFVLGSWMGQLNCQWASHLEYRHSGICPLPKVFGKFE